MTGQIALSCTRSIVKLCHMFVVCHMWAITMLTQRVVQLFFPSLYCSDGMKRQLHIGMVTQGHSALVASMALLSLHHLRTALLSAWSWAYWTGSIWRWALMNTRIVHQALFKYFVYELQPPAINISQWIVPHALTTEGWYKMRSPPHFIQLAHK